MKPIQKYAVVRDVVPGRPFKLIGMTKIAGRQVFGRFMDGASTHCAERDVLTYLPTEQAARLFMERAEKIKAKHRRSITEAERALNDAVRDEAVQLRCLVIDAQTEARDAR